MLNRTEILAPAGTACAVRAAVNAGADAVYLGGSMFSARAFAGNFDEAELIDTIDYCHIHDVRVYLAINTLLRNDEIKMLPKYVEPYYREGVDGIIVQDVGVVSVLSGCYPDLPLHGSTQMSVSSEYGAAFLRNLGMTRFVPSRELSLKEIRDIKNRVDIEIETFVHGAMCYSYSGRCLMSSYAGGRSGNRGRCAQPCRRLYTVNDGSNACYALSMKDMCMLGRLDELMEAGIDSFKIEGRMKKPEYVAACVRAYREVRDACLNGDDIMGIAAEHEKVLLDVYNRGGFCSGYYFTGNGRAMLADKRPNHTGLRIGGVERLAPPYVDIRLSEKVGVGDVLEIRGRREDVELTSNAHGDIGALLRLKAKSFKAISVGDEVYRTRNAGLLSELSDIAPAKVGLSAELSAHVGEPLTLRLKCGDIAVCSEGILCETASKSPVTSGQIIQRLTRTGDTEYVIDDVSVDVDEDVFVRLGAVNELRRCGLELMSEALKAHFRRRDGLAVLQDVPKESGGAGNDKCGFMVCVRTPEQVSIVKNYKWIHTVALDYSIYSHAAELKAAGQEVLIILPEILRQNKLDESGDAGVSAMIDVINDSRICDGVVLRNIDELGLIKSSGYTKRLLLSPSLYAYNDDACEFYKTNVGAAGLGLMASEELTLEELSNMSYNSMIKIYGHQEVMVTAGCVRLNYCGETGSKLMTLTDEKGNRFYVKADCERCLNVIYNGVPTDITDKRDMLGGLDNCYAEFTIEDGRRTKEILDVLSDGLHLRHAAGDFTRGHYYKGVE